MTPTLLAGVLLLTAGAPRLKDPPATHPPLVGRWACQGPVGLEYEFARDGTWVIYQGGRVIDGTARTYRLNRADGAGAVDLWEGDPGYPGVYRVEGDRLSLSFRHSGAGRPPAADARGDGVLTLTFTRVRKD
jgi:hypothetical protein